MNEATCSLPPADESQLELDRLVMGTSYKYLCDICKQWHRVAPEYMYIETATGMPRPGWEEEKKIARATGYTCMLDPSRGGGWCSFIRGSVHVWSCQKGWARADLLNGHYMNHRYHVHLKDALEGIGGMNAQKT